MLEHQSYNQSGSDLAQIEWQGMNIGIYTVQGLKREGTVSETLD